MNPPFRLNFSYKLFDTLLNILGDYMNSKEYRKPEWVTRMEEIQKRLAGNFIMFVNAFEMRCPVLYISLFSQKLRHFIPKL